MSYSQADLLIIVPVLSRPHRAELVLKSALTATPDASVLFVGSPGDTAEHEAVAAAGGTLLVIPEPVAHGDYARKVNAAYRSTAHRLLFMGADDIDFRPGWFEAAVACLGGGIEVVGTNDLGNRRVVAGMHSTHTLVTRHYVDTFGTIDEPRTVLHEGYAHEFVDDEFVETAKHRDAFRWCGASIVEHLHPHWGKAETDALYDEQPARMRYGRIVYRNRRHKWGM